MLCGYNSQENTEPERVKSSQAGKRRNLVVVSVEDPANRNDVCHGAPYFSTRVREFLAQEQAPVNSLLNQSGEKGNT